MKRFLPVLIVAFVSWTCDASQWFLDNSVVTGANDGSSWPNAWHHLNSINFASIHAGDTIFVSGGPTAGSQTYGGFFNDSGAAPNGANGNPITFTMGTDASHNGTAIFDGAENGDGFSYINLISKQYWVIDGQSAGDGVRHMWFNNLFNSNANQRTSANKIYADGSTGMVFKFLNGTNDNQFISLVNSFSFYVGHCYADYIRGDAVVRAPGCGPDAFDSNIIENNQFYLSYCTNHALCDSPPGTNFLGPDCIQGSHGLTVRYNHIEEREVPFCTSTQHPDYTQFTGNHNQMYGNDFVNIGDSCHDMDWVFNPTPHDIRIYNNVYRITKAMDPFPEYIRWYASAGTSFSSMINILIANNTFVDNTAWSDLLCNWGASGSASLSGWVIANNIHVNGAAYSIPNNPMISGNSLGFGTNVYAPAFQFSYRGTTYNSSTWPTIEPSSIFAVPAFVSYAPNAVNNDMHLSPGDTVAKGKGVDLSAYFTTDKDGNTRTAPWSIGAYQAGGSPPPMGPNTPSNVSPPDMAVAVSITPTLNASAYSDPNGPPSAQTHAQFLVYASDGTTVVWDSGTLGAVTSTTVSTPLSNGNTYFWTARYENSIPVWSAYSPQTQFTTVPLVPLPPVTPSNVSPANGATGVSVTTSLTGSAYSDPNSPPSGATAAQFIVYASNQSDIVWDSGPIIGPPVGHVPPGTLANGTLYWWAMRYQNSIPLWSDFSAQTSFTTFNLPPPTNQTRLQAVSGRIGRIAFP